MRLIKLSTAEFPDEAALQHYFGSELPSRAPPGLFVFPNGWISADGVEPGETILFSYRGRLRFVSKSITGRTRNTTEHPKRYPHGLVIDMESLLPTDIPLLELERRLRDELGFDKSLAQSQGWPKIPNGADFEAMVRNAATAKSSSPTAIAPHAFDVPPRPDRIETTTLRVIRDTAKALLIKPLHDGRCQFCGETITLPGGRCYAEAHHIRPLGAPHNGPDVAENIVCVCPNHHAELDYGAAPITISALRSATGHRIDAKYVDYHNTVIYRPDGD